MINLLPGVEEGQPYQRNPDAEQERVRLQQGI
jgi:hypothetical protein